MKKNKCLKIIYLLIILLLLNISSVSAKNYEVYKDKTLVIKETSSIEGNVQVIEGADKITVSFNSKADDKKITIRGKVAGEAKIRYKRKNKGGTLQITHTIKVILTEEQQEEQKQEQLEKEVEDVEEKIEELDTYYTKDINEIKSGDYYEKSKYIKSILINDEKNGNFNLWNKFVKETTPEERKAWETEISKHVRGEGVEASARDALGDQIRLDEGKITKDEFEDEIKGEQEQQKEHYLELVELKSQIIGERLPAEFEDILDNIEGYNKPSDLDSGTANKIGKAANKVLTTIMNIGMVAAILMIAILGIKYMLGSVEEKAEYKKDLVPYLIGACLLFGISAFVKIFMQWGEMISNL